MMNTTLLWDVPYRDLSLVRNNDRDYLFTFEDMNTPVVPIFSNIDDDVGGTQGISQRKLVDFPDGTQFKFRALDDDVDIAKDGVYNDTTKEVKFSFTPADTADVDRDRRTYYEIDAIYPGGKRYTILSGYLNIFATRRLNT